MDGVSRAGGGGELSPRRVHVLTCHPDPASLTVAVAGRVEEELRSSGHAVTSQNVADGSFATAFTAADLAFNRSVEAGESGRVPPADVLAQQVILESSDVLVLVFPVFWWSMPAELKGWVDRVFTLGWTWGLKRTGRTRSALAHLDVVVVPLAGSSEAIWRREGYHQAIDTQVQRGIIEYNGLRSGTWTWIWHSTKHPEESLKQAGEVVREIRQLG